jgi:hypothetical protein
VWDATVFTKNRERLLAGDVARAFLEHVVNEARARQLLSNEHFSVDGTLIEAWASLKSFQRKDGPGGPPPDDPGNPTVDFHGERRSNDTHASTTDPDARPYRKGNGKEATLCHQGHALMDNRHGLVVDGLVTSPAGTAEREVAVEMLGRVPCNGRLTVGAVNGRDLGFLVTLFQLSAAGELSRVRPARPRLRSAPAPPRLIAASCGPTPIPARHGSRSANPPAAHAAEPCPRRRPSREPLPLRLPRA